MNLLAIFLSGLLALGIASRVQPMRGWLSDLLTQRELLVFLLPLLVLFTWPIDNVISFREGNDLGWHRVVRIIAFTGYFAYGVATALYRRKFLLPRLGVFGTFALYMAFAAASALYSPEPQQSLWKAFELLVIMMYALHIYAGLVRDPENVTRLCNSLLYLAFGFCLMSLVGGLLAPEIAWNYLARDGEGLPSMNGVAPLINANMLGQLGGIIALVGIFNLLSHQVQARFGYVLVAVVGGLTLVLAYSRTSLIAFSILLFFLLAMLRKHRLLLFMVPFLLFGIFLFEGAILTYLARGQSAELMASLSGRTYMWDAALEAWRQSPLLGQGYFVGHKYVQLSGGRFLITVDSTYVETLVNLGVIGLVLMGAFAMGALRMAWHVLGSCRDRYRNMLPQATALFIFVAFIIVRSFTASSFQSLHLNLLLLMLVIANLYGLRFNLKKGRL